MTSRPRLVPAAIRGATHRREILERILDGEAYQAALGGKAFRRAQGDREKATGIVAKSCPNLFFAGVPKPRLNDSTRSAAGLPLDIYGSLAS